MHADRTLSNNTLSNNPLWELGRAQADKTATATFASTLTAAQEPKPSTPIQELAETDTVGPKGNLSGVDIKGLEQFAAGSTYYWRQPGKTIEPNSIEAPLPQAAENLCVLHAPTEAVIEPQVTPNPLKQTISSATEKALGHLDSATYLETFFKRQTTTASTH